MVPSSMRDIQGWSCLVEMRVLASLSRRPLTSLCTPHFLSWLCPVTSIGERTTRARLENVTRHLLRPNAGRRIYSRKSAGAAGVEYVEAMPLQNQTILYLNDGLPCLSVTVQCRSACPCYLVLIASVGCLRLLLDSGANAGGHFAPPNTEPEVFAGSGL